MTLPLEGIRVVDLTTVLFGPFATQLLGDLGAEVIKVEGPEGDPTRAIGPARHDGMAAGFFGANRNKKSICLNLKREPARQALWALVDSADVFVHNIRPQKIRKLGFDPDSVMARNERIVYGAFHGYLEEGPYGGRPAYDDVIQGESGLAGAFLARDGKPAFVPSVVADKSAGLTAAAGLLAAMFQQLRSGKGVYMEIGMFESMAAYTLIEHQFGLTFSPPIGTAGYTRVISPQRKPYATKDGFICMLAYTDRQWQSFWTYVGTPDVAEDPRYLSMADRTRNIDALYAQAGEALTSRTTEEWLKVLTELEIPCGRINTFEEIRDDVHLNQIDFFRAYQHPSEGDIEVLDTGLRFNRQRLPIREHQPSLGEQGDSILRDIGMTDTDISAALAGDDQ